MKTFQEILKEKGLTGHRLYIASGAPWRVLDDIFSGRTSLARCSEETLGRLSNALDMPLDVLAKTKVELQPTGEYLADPTYLETGLPPSIGKAIADYVEGEKNDVLHLDCLLWRDCVPMHSRFQRPCRESFTEQSMPANGMAALLLNRLISSGKSTCLVIQKKIWNQRKCPGLVCGGRNDETAGRQKT